LEQKGASDTRSDAKSDANCVRTEADRTPDGVTKLTSDLSNIDSRYVIVKPGMILIFYTGDLYFAYLKFGDHKAGDHVYQCRVTYLDRQNPWLISVSNLVVATSTEPPGDISVVYPTASDSKVIRCTEGRECRVRCIFGGR